MRAPSDEPVQRLLGLARRRVSRSSVSPTCRSRNRLGQRRPAGRPAASGRRRRRSRRRARRHRGSGGRGRRAGRAREPRGKRRRVLARDPGAHVRAGRSPEPCSTSSIIAPMLPHELPTRPGAPRRSSAASSGCDPPAGLESARAGRRRSRGRGHPRRYDAGRRRPLGRPAAVRRLRRSAGRRGRLDERARPGLVRAHLALELRRRPGRVQAPVLAAQRPGQRSRSPSAGRRARCSPRSHGAEGRGQQVGAATSASRASSAGAVSVAVERHARRRRSAPCRGRRPSASASRRSRDRRRGSSPGSAWRRGGAAAARDAGSARRAAGRAARPARSGRSRRAPAAPAQARGPRRPTPRARRRLGVRMVGMPSCWAASSMGVGVSRVSASAGRGGAVTTPTSSAVGRRGKSAQARGRRTRRSRGRRFAPDAGPARWSRQGARRLADLRVVLVALADGHQLIHRVQVVDVELAVEVVELVLERPAEQPRAGHLDLAPRCGPGPRPRPARDA